MTDTKATFIFPGQGSQYVGMGRDFYASYSLVRQTVEEAEDLLGMRISTTVLEGPEDFLKETHQSQVGIFVISVAISRVLWDLFPDLEPWACSGLSLGEYTALTVGGWLDYSSCLSLVSYRGQYMQECCKESEGTMAVVMGLSAQEVQSVVDALNMPQELVAANFNCPGQVVISGSHKGIDAATLALKERGAKRVLPLRVDGAFHSPLMQSAADRLRSHVLEAPIKQGNSQLVMNVPGDFVEDVQHVQENLIRQVVAPVRWEQGIRALEKASTQLFVEIGPGSSLSGMNKRIGTLAPTVKVESTNDLRGLEEIMDQMVEC